MAADESKDSPPFSEDAGGISYAERVPVGLRLVAGFFGVAMLVIPYPFIIYTHWLEPSLTTLVGALGVIAPLLVCALFFGITLVPERQMRFDAVRRVLTDNFKGPFYRGRRETAFIAISDITISMRQPEDGEAYPVLTLQMTGRRPLEIGTFTTRETAEYWRGRILALRRGS